MTETVRSAVPQVPVSSHGAFETQFPCAIPGKMPFKLMKVLLGGYQLYHPHNKTHEKHWKDFKLWKESREKSTCNAKKKKKELGHA